MKMKINGRLYGENKEYGEWGAMIKSRKTPLKETIPKPIEGYTDIEPKDLALKKLTTQEQEIIDKFIKGQKGTFTFISFIFAAFGLIFGGAMIYNIVIGTEMPVSDIIEAIIMSLIFLVGIPMLMNHFKKGYDDPISGAQVGQLNGIWSMSAGAGSKGRHYYFDVKFDNNTRIKKVICNSRETYYTMQENDKILVITFHGMNAYGFKLNY